MIPKSLIKKIRALEISTRQIVNSTMAGGYHSAFKGQGINFADLREYQIGDEIRNIHWSVSARMNTPYVKLYEEERDLTVFIMIDLSGSGEIGTHKKTKVEIAAEIAAILGFSAIKNNDNVGLILFTDQVELFIPAKKGKKHVLRLLREIIYFRPKSKQTNIENSLMYLNNMVKKKAIIFLISDFQDDTFEKSFAMMAKKHDCVPILIEDDIENQLPSSGIIAFQDQETDEVLYVDSSSKELQEAYKNMRFSEKNKLDRFFKKVNCDMLRLDTKSNYITALTMFFRNRLRKYR